MLDEETNLVVPGGMLLQGYRVHRPLGRGSYGIVYCATEEAQRDDPTRNAPVALKIVKKQAAYHRQAQLEVSVLREVHRRYAKDPRIAHVVELRHSMEYEGHTCLVFGSLSHTLHAEAYQFSPRGRSGTVWNISRIRDVCRQVLHALTLLESMNTMHCDVKPENVMYEHGSKEALRLIDFGSVRPLERNDYYDVQSLWYRAPEVLQRRRYDCKIDTWSVGCMAVELYTRTPLFPGVSVADQMRRITNLLGRPESLAAFLATHLGPDTTSSASLQRSFVDFVAQCLSVDPARRPLPSEALQHPIFQGCVRVRDPPQVPWVMLGDDDATWSPGSAGCDPEQDLSEWVLDGNSATTSPSASSLGSTSFERPHHIPYFDYATTAF